MNTSAQTPLSLSYSINDFCRAVGIGRSKAYAEIKDGRLRAIKCGKRTLIRSADAEAWLNSLAEVQEGV